MSKKQKHVLGLSGGKDSSALALYMNKHYPEIEMDYFFAGELCCPANENFSD